ncbi:MAG: DUF2029 domain-containing protein [Phycisphaerae bacterium]|nr:DUF2029 domain-containing protein [Phycisphaerae bacterium]
MKNASGPLIDRLPYSIPLSEDPRRRRAAMMARLAAYALLAAALIAPVIQLQHKILRNRQRLETYRREKAQGALSAAEKAKGRPKGHKGALNRWRPQIRALWRGENIYVTTEQYVAENAARPADQKRHDVGIRHPNSIFMVLLLTPFAYLPTSAAGLVFSLLKVAVYLAAAFAAVRVCNDGPRRMPDWVVGLGLAWWITLGISDIQHANTNGFVLGAIVLHLWLYRRGHDAWAGAALAAAVAMKLTPVLFVLYWLYQRNWRLLGGCVVAGLLTAVVLPAAIFGPGRYFTLTQTWLDNIIFSGLGGAWYPIHVNQSLPAILGRYLLGGQPGGDLHWNPDDFPYRAVERMGGHAWIAFASLSETTVRWIIKGVQALIVLLAAWSIGITKRPRDDARRGLHYAMILAAMMLLNQRTWDHHAAVLLPATLAVWYAVAFGRMGRLARGAALGMILLAGVLLWASAGDAVIAVCRLTGMAKHQAEIASDVVQAYGPKGACFLLIFLAAAVLCRAMRRSEPPCAEQRQRLFVKNTLP